MPAAETTNDILSIITGIGGLILLIIVVGTIIYWIFNRKKGFKDEWREMQKEMIADSKLNVPDHMKELYRIHIPFLGDFLGSVTDENKDIILHQLRELFDVYRKKGVLLGNITGYNCIDMIASVEDSLVPTRKNDDILNNPEYAKERKEIETLLKECGRFLHVIVYKPRKQSILKWSEEVLICFSDQVLGVESQDGVVAVIGEGTDRLLGGYFGIPSGYPHRVKSALTYLIGRGWIRGAMRTQGALVELIEDAIRLDPVTQKLLAGQVMSNRGGKLEEK
jgi:hypothetical protein